MKSPGIRPGFFIPGSEHGEAHVEVEPEAVGNAFLVVQHRIGKVQFDRGVDHREFDPQPVTDTDVRAVERSKPGVGRIADIDKYRAADEVPDRVRDFRREEVHEIASVIILVLIHRTDRAIGEAADRVAASEEVTFVNRRIFLPVSDGTDHADFRSE